MPAGTTTIGIRPEGFALAADNAEAVFTADVTVDAVELVGAESYVHARLADDTAIIFSVAGRTQIASGEKLKISASESAIHCFDKDGKRIEPTV